jgi:hypothetical protein
VLPNRATAVETSPASHIVMSPISFHYHHHHPPPPPLHAATAAAVKRPSHCPHLGQAGAGSSTPPPPFDAATSQSSGRPPTPLRHPNDTPQRHHITAPNDTDDAAQWRHVTAPNDADKAAQWRHVIAPNGATSQLPNDFDDKAVPMMPCHRPPTTPRQPKVSGKLGWSGGGARVLGTSPYP